MGRYINESGREIKAFELLPRGPSYNVSILNSHVYKVLNLESHPVDTYTAMSSFLTVACRIQIYFRNQQCVKSPLSAKRIKCEKAFSLGRTTVLVSYPSRNVKMFIVTEHLILY